MINCFCWPPPPFVPNYLIRATSRAKWVKLMNHIKNFFMIGDRSKHVFVSRIGSLLGLMIGCKVKEVEKIASNTRKCLPSLTNVNGITRIVLEHGNDRWLQFHLNRWRGYKAWRSQEDLLKYSSKSAFMNESKSVIKTWKWAYAALNVRHSFSSLMASSQFCHIRILIFQLYLSLQTTAHRTQSLGTRLVLNITSQVMNWNHRKKLNCNLCGWK